MTDIHDNIIWSIIDTYFKDNPDILVKHHIDSYNDFFGHKLQEIFKQNNPITLQKEKLKDASAFQYECNLYLGGKDGKKIYYGKPIIYDDNDAHFMLPNEARLRNMTYGFAIHYDVEVDIIVRTPKNERGASETFTTEKQTMTIPKVLLGRFPIMLQSNYCVLQGLDSETRFAMGECRNDPGGYFIIDGKEKAIVSQEKFGDNMLYVRDEVNDMYSHSAEIRSVSEDPSKPKRTMNVRMVAPTPARKNSQIVVSIPNVRKPVPLFIVMRALGLVSDKEIIETCLLDLDKNESMIDLFRPSVHDACEIFTQTQALRFIATFTKGKTVASVMEILMNYFLPHIGELNFKDKAYYLGYMVKRMLMVYTKQDKPTDRDSYSYKRIEVSGTLIRDLFVEYYKLQKVAIRQAIDKEYYYHRSTYQGNFSSLIEGNHTAYFSDRIVETGFRKGFKGNWGAQEHTKRLGLVQDLNRLSFFSFIAHMRKLNLPMDSSAKVVKPRLLHPTQWGIICPVHTPDGANVGFHKHMTMGAHITSGCSGVPMKQWLLTRGAVQLQETSSAMLGNNTKVFVNGTWFGIINSPQEIVKEFKLQRRNGLLPFYNSITWNIRRNEIHISTDAGRMMRPIFYLEDGMKVSYERGDYVANLNEKTVSWETLLYGTSKKPDDYNIDNCKVYDARTLLETEDKEEINRVLEAEKGCLEYIDTSESEGLLIAMNKNDIQPNTRFTHLEIHPSLALSVMGNMVIYPENNQLPRDLFSCGQSKQAASLYHSNYRNRIDKMGVMLNNGQIPIVKSRYLNYVTKEQHPYGENAIVAIMCYSGYNVEDALIFNEGAIKRGLFNTTYFNNYESRESSTKVAGTMVDSQFCDVQNMNVVKQRAGYDYAYLNENGIIRENTRMDDKKMVIGKCTQGSEPGTFNDDSTKPKKGQLGVVDKSFITTGEEGFRIAKVRIREHRIPAIGDKFCSRAGQKGTVGIILPEEDMPFTADGIRPDLIVNPHALPSRMTIGHLVECLISKACVLQGGYGDCTAFVNNGPQHKVFGDLLVQNGYNSTGNEILYNGMTGEQLEMEIFFGPTYYLRLKHMVKDKINYRARGPRTAMTRQPVHGRAKDGGLRIGEMDRDALIAHGLARFLQESMMDRSDDFYMAVCNKTGAIAIYNESQNIFLSPLADGPIQFSGSLDGSVHIDHMSRFGRDFSIVRVPYTFKLLMHELQTMNISLRIITEDNIEQLTTMTYDPAQIELNTGSDSYNELLLKYGEITGEPAPVVKTETPYTEVTPEEEEDEETALPSSPEWAPESPPYVPTSPPMFEPKTPDMQKYTVGILVPFRHQPKLESVQGQNRLSHREEFLRYMKEFVYQVSQYTLNSLGFLIIPKVQIVEQSEDGRKFNRGALLNSGFLDLQAQKRYDAVFLHDVDLLPRMEMVSQYANAINTVVKQTNPYHVVHLAHKWGRYKDLGKMYIGGVTLVSSAFFNDINGFPTYFEGWGGEDDALRKRIIDYTRESNGIGDDVSEQDVLSRVIQYPETLPEDGFIDLENIDNYKDKREVLNKDDELDNKLKREGRLLDQRIWKYNGLRNPSAYGPLFEVTKSEVMDAQYQTIMITVQLNKDLVNYLFINEKLGSLTDEQLSELVLTERLPLTYDASSIVNSKDFGLSPVFDIDSTPKEAPVFSPHTPEGPAPETPKEPTTPVFTGASPVQPETPPELLAMAVPRSPVPTSPVAPTSPEEKVEKEESKVTPDITPASYSPGSLPSDFGEGMGAKSQSIENITDSLEANEEPLKILKIDTEPLETEGKDEEKEEKKDEPTKSVNAGITKQINVA